MSSSTSHDYSSRKRDCVKDHKPICLEKALELIFGIEGADGVKHIAEKEFEHVSETIDTPTKVWALYACYIGSLERKIGKSSTFVIESEVQKQIESMGCTSCPIYQRISENGMESGW